MDPDFGLAQRLTCGARPRSAGIPGQGAGGIAKVLGTKSPTRRIHGVGVAGGIRRLGCEGIDRCLHSIDLVTGVHRAIGTAVDIEVSSVCRIEFGETSVLFAGAAGIRRKFKQLSQLVMPGLLASGEALDEAVQTVLAGNGLAPGGGQ